jgi:hypothetical protein
VEAEARAVIELLGVAREVRFEPPV